MNIELQKYKGKATRHTCPSCGRKDSFVLYIDTDTNKAIHYTVGRCNRESNCGYHHTPKQYFEANGISKPKYTEYKAPTPAPAKPMEFLSADLVVKSANMDSNFITFLGSIFNDKNRISNLFDMYHIGATKAKEVIFWQIDEFNRVRTGKIMQYDPTTGKRSKTQSTDWIHSRMIKAENLKADFNFKQCFFGQHLLTDKTKTIAIVEAEKTAIICSALMPDFIWIAAGQLHGLNIDKCGCFAGRNLVLFPDLSVKQPNRMTAFEIWSAKAAEIMKKYSCKIIVSDLLERKATESDRQNGLDIADYLIKEQRAKMPQNEIEQAISEPAPAPAPAPTPTPTPKNLFNIGMELIGEQNHLSKQTLIDRMAQMYHITNTRAEIGLKSLLNGNIIDNTHLGTYYMTHSTPY